jgi:ketosteroid isomerase-like protein
VSVDTGEPHPYAAAWRSRDLDAWGEALADDVVLDSPLIERPFVGRATALDLFAALFSSVDDIEITDHLTSNDVHVFVWTATAGGRTISGVDQLTHAATGEITRITVFVRPLTGLGAFAHTLGPALARRRSRARGIATSALMPPLRIMLLAIDRVSTKLVGLR